MLLCYIWVNDISQASWKVENVITCSWEEVEKSVRVRLVQAPSELALSLDKNLAGTLMHVRLGSHRLAIVVPALCCQIGSTWRSSPLPILMPSSSEEHMEGMLLFSAARLITREPQLSHV